MGRFGMARPFCLGATRRRTGGIRGTLT
jgi:hypothetical protein